MMSHGFAELLCLDNMQAPAKCDAHHAPLAVPVGQLQVVNVHLELEPPRLHPH